jgi:hypothetical protein
LAAAEPEEWKEKEGDSGPGRELEHLPMMQATGAEEKSRIDPTWKTGTRMNPVSSGSRVCRAT